MYLLDLKECALLIPQRRATGGLSRVMEREDTLTPFNPKVPLLQNGVANSDSGRLQEVNIQYLEDAPPYQTPPELMRPSGSKTTGLGSAQNQRGGSESPIRTLSKKPTRPPSTRAPTARRFIRSPA
ncbi:hypothetical protein F2Q69_00042047 [Brassica cretica]|uniref:Uncharacterized protein n=1 Tax=Brassica cretica TaxID=69181 RepID=A0A8S9N6L8_BRACR|nr:hypothetical protein F2Q69_00042047 [Brassica cretica]